MTNETSEPAATAAVARSFCRTTSNETGAVSKVRELEEAVVELSKLIAARMQCLTSVWPPGALGELKTSLEAIGSCEAAMMGDLEVAKVMEPVVKLIESPGVAYE